MNFIIFSKIFNIGSLSNILLVLDLRPVQHAEILFDVDLMMTVESIFVHTN